TEESRSGADRQRNAEQRMRKRSTIAGVIGVGLLLSATSYADPYNPAERAIGGGVDGAGTGAVIRAIARGGHSSGTRPSRGGGGGGGVGGRGGSRHNRGAAARVKPPLPLRPSSPLSELLSEAAVAD